MSRVGTAVETTADIVAAHPEVTPRDAAAVRTLLNDQDTPQQPVALWLAEWLCDEKPLEYFPGPAPVASVVVTRETDKAWGVYQAEGRERDVIFVPKSQSVLFRAADGVEQIDSSQQTLGELVQ